MLLSMIIGVGLSLFLFVFLPSAATKGIEALLDEIFIYVDLGVWRNVIEGVLKMAIFIGYLGLTLLMKDIRRTFEYHGAEHKTIFCYEQGLELTVENVRKQKRFHPRCGTSFLIIMVLVGIFIGFFIPAGIPNLARVGIKLLLVPVIMGIGYELIKLCGKHDNLLTRAVAAPGKWFQRITVLEPDDGMIECAIAAITKAIPDDGSDKIQ
jgi:uncharacterized protein YqhQ